MTRILKIAMGRRDWSAAMSVVAVLVASGLTKAGYAPWGIGVVAGLGMLAGGLELFRRDPQEQPTPLRANELSQAR